MDVSATDTHGLEQALKTRVLPLKASWQDSAFDGAAVAEAPANDWRQDHEFYWAADDAAPGAEKQKIYIIVRHPTGLYTGMWVDPDDSYDMAVFNQDFDAALAIAEERLAEDPENPEHLFDKAYAMAYIDGADWNEILALYDRVLELSPDDAWALNNKSITLRELGREDEAFDCIKRAAEVSGSTLIHINLAYAYLRTQDMEKYFDTLEYVLGTEPAGIDDRLALFNFRENSALQTVDDVRRARENHRLSSPAPDSANPVFH